MTPGDELHIDHATRVVTASGEAGVTSMRVPLLFGVIESAERRGDYILIITEGGRVSFHATTPRRGTNKTWRDTHPLAGTMHWHSITKALRTHCLLAQLRRRVNFEVTHSRFSSGMRSSVGAGGRVTVDKRTVLQCSNPPTPDGCVPAELGSALAEYLYLDPVDALSSDNRIVASVALLDRRLPGAAFAAVDPKRLDYPLWISFHALRAAAQLQEAEAALATELDD